jgi:hypothetical protein
MIAIPIIDNAIALLKDGLDRFIPDKNQAAQAKAALDQLRQQEDGQEFLATADIVKTEAASTHWLAANWRPLTMLIFVALIVARVLGWTSHEVPTDEYEKLWDLVKLGLVGYVYGRSAEKIAPQIAAMVKK